MESAAVILFGLVATSLLLSITLAVAWRRFGREAHAALWSLAYGLSAANWTDCGWSPGAAGISTRSGTVALACALIRTWCAAGLVT